MNTQMNCIDRPSTPPSALSLGRLLLDCGLINEHQLMDALQAQAAGGGRLGSLLVKRGCLGEDQLAVVLATQDAMRASALALEISVMVTPVGDDIQDMVRLAVALTKTPTNIPQPMPTPVVRAQQSLVADMSQRMSVCAVGDAQQGFRMRELGGATIPYKVSLCVGLDHGAEHLPCGTRHILSSTDRSNGAQRLRLKVHVDPRDLKAAPTGRFEDTLCIAFG
ncbi:MAG: hypothetical protein P8Q36_07670 [Alphaproteobacteria bacterium]|nr:hypothetical protein [Rhodospirillaceae bacterium]MBT6206069.1 hypothetical protein [Rhodospirillaceae bacterium]MDG2480732.1 hypothetical protein [Alphaproteobacteria bacterium]